VKISNALPALLLCWATPLLAESESEQHRCAPDGLGVGGYDLVSYHQSAAPMLGSEAFELEYDGLRYRFVSAQNREQFLTEPEAYLPHYQGWCAATLSMGRLACPDYTNFKIENGDLLLFELAGFTNGRTLWDSDPQGFRQRADANAIKLLP
jgi:hypothetical protein